MSVCVRQEGDERCPLHITEKVTMECEDCPGTLVCNECIATVHRRHAFRTLKDSVAEKAQYLQYVAEEVKSTLLPQAEQKFKMDMKTLNDKKEDILKAMDYARVQCTLVKQEAERNTSERITVMQGMLKDIQNAISKLQTEFNKFYNKMDRKIKDAEETVSTGSDVLVFDKALQINGREIEPPVTFDVPVCEITPCKNLQELIAKALGGFSLKSENATYKDPKTVMVQGQEPLTASILAAAAPHLQKRMLGERLFPLIQRMFPDLCGKITGMLLGLDNSELLYMLKSPGYLETKVNEAVTVLKVHQAM